MSTAAKKPRALAPKNAKNAKKEVAPEPVKAEPAKVEAPKVEAPKPEPAKVEAPNPEAAKPEAAPKVKLPPPIIVTATSRVATNINTMGVNALAKARHAELDDKLKSYEHAKAVLAAGKLTDTREVEKTENGVTTKTKESFERAITAEEKAAFTKTAAELEHTHLSMAADSEAYAHACLRFAKNTPAAIAVVVDESVKQLVGHAMSVCDAGNHKMVKLEHLYSSGVEKLSLAALLLPLHTSVEVRTSLEKKQRENAERVAKEVLLKNQEKELKRRYHITKKDVAAAAAKEAAAAPAAVAAPAPEPEEADDEADVPVDRKTSFNHYAKEICKIVGDTDFAAKKLRVSGEVYAHLARLMKEFHNRLAPMLAESVRYDKSKTIQVETVLFALKLLLIDGHAPVETIELKNVDIPNPDVLKAEQEKKAAEKKAGRQYKIDMSKIPNVIGRQAVHTVTYPTSGYAALEATVRRKLAEVEAEEAAKKTVEAAPAK